MTRFIVFSPGQNNELPQWLWGNSKQNQSSLEIAAILSAGC
jgi:hypothetical protein